MNKFFKKRSHANIRRGQLITTFGPGALINLDLGSFIGMGIDSWDKTGFHDVIYEERLQNRLKVKYFRQPPSAEIFPKGIPYRRFPRWLFCPNPKCRLLKTYDEWVKNDTRSYPTIPKCNTCKYKSLVPMSFLIACKNGHLDDFPWVQWVHRDKIPCSSSPTLKYASSLAGAGLAGTRIECTGCNVSRNMQGAFSPDAFKTNCSGGRPWSKNNTNESCTAKPVTVQRGGSNVYFPRVVSSITIPPYTNTLLNEIKSTDAWNAYTSSLGIIDEETLKSQCFPKIAEELNRPFSEIKACLDDMEKLAESAESQSEEEYRFDEYQAFHGRYDPSTNNKKDFEVVKGNEGHEYTRFGIKDIYLVKSLREIRALLGFTRLRPFEPDMEYAGTDENYEISELVPLVDKEGRQATWKPAVEVRGEGIFLTLDEDKLSSWSNNKQVKERQDKINKNLGVSCRRRQISFKPVGAEFVLLHTLAHLLIRQLSFESGYSGASLRERIYCSQPHSREKMHGFLIYTAAGDSDGTLGGLVRQAKPERFASILSSIVENLKWCANDPLCIESNGQGFESLNLSACYACALLPETSCEVFNKFLDRAFVVGTSNFPEMGYLNMSQG